MVNSKLGVCKERWVFHGTSFENACRILSKEYWVPSIGDCIESVAQLYKTLGKVRRYDLNDMVERIAKEEVLFVTTSFNRALSYANQYKRPVVLCFKEVTFPFWQSTVKPGSLKTAKIKAYTGGKGLHIIYGKYINSIYKTNKSLVNAVSLRER